MMEALLNRMRMEAERAQARVAKTRHGIVEGYDPSHYACKVRIQPENTLTGWLPIKSPWVGSGWGMYAPPSLGDAVEVQYQEGDQESGTVGERFYSTVVVPLPCPSGEFWLVHASGSFIKLLNDGTIRMKGDLYVDGNIFATQDIVDQTATTNESMRSQRAIFNTHKHLDTQPGAGLTGLPTPTE